MSAKHTAEPWRVSAGRCIKQDFTDIGLGNDSGAIIATVPGGKTSGPFFIEDDAEVSANARRIVACVNACAGISTDALESILDWDKAGIEAALTSRTQRDELLAACKEALESGNEGDWQSARQALAAAIAKAES